jgi:hypothetical protein
MKDGKTRKTHPGGDFFMNYHFANAIRSKVPPYFDVYRGVTASIVGILAYRSALKNSCTFDLPDFRQKSVRKEFVTDHWQVDPIFRKKEDPWLSMTGDIKPSRKMIVYAEKIWKSVGYINEKKDKN